MFVSLEQARKLQEVFPYWESRLADRWNGDGEPKGFNTTSEAEEILVKLAVNGELDDINQTEVETTHFNYVNYDDEPPYFEFSNVSIDLKMNEICDVENDDYVDDRWLSIDNGLLANFSDPVLPSKVVSVFTHSQMKCLYGDDSGQSYKIQQFGARNWENTIDGIQFFPYECPGDYEPYFVPKKYTASDYAGEEDDCETVPEFPWNDWLDKHDELVVLYRQPHDVAHHILDAEKIKPSVEYVKDACDGVSHDDYARYYDCKCAECTLKYMRRDFRDVIQDSRMYAIVRVKVSNKHTIWHAYDDNLLKEVACVADMWCASSDICESIRNELEVRKRVLEQQAASIQFREVVEADKVVRLRQERLLERKAELATMVSAYVDSFKDKVADIGNALKRAPDIGDLPTQKRLREMLVEAATSAP